MSRGIDRSRAYLVVGRTAFYEARVRCQCVGRTIPIAGVLSLAMMLIKPVLLSYR